jgi:preprotein translocase SecE subunit
MASIRNTGKATTSPASANRTRQFLEETWVELRYKVTWSSKQQLLKSTSVVLTVVLIVSLFIYVLDTIFGAILRKFLL